MPKRAEAGDSRKKDRVFKKDPLSFFLWYGLFTEIKKFISPTKPPKGLMWESISYLDQLTKYPNPENLINYMSLELETFFHEYVAFRFKKVYSNFGTRGINNLSKRDMVEIAVETRADLAAQKLDTTRATTDIGAMTKIMAFLEDESVRAGDVLVYISPRGPNFLYLGYEEEANNYINFYIKQKSGEAKLVQVLNYDQNPALLKFLEYLQKKHQATKYFPEYLDIDESGRQLDFKSLTKEHVIVQSVLLIHDGEPQITTIINQSLKNRRTWKVNVENFPVLNKQNYLKQENRLITFFKKAMIPIMQTAQTVDEGEKNILAQKINTLVQIMKRHFLKWTELNAQNYNQLENIQNNDIELNLIEEEWLLICKEIEGKALNAKEKTRKKSLTLTARLSRSTPLAHLQKLKFCPTRIKFDNRLASTQAGNGIFKMGGVELVRYIEKHDYITIKLAGEHWKVPTDYMKKRGCYEKNGVAYGPCGIPLNEDPYAIKENDYLNLAQQNSPTKTRRATFKNPKLDEINVYPQAPIGLSEFVAVRI